MAKVVDARAFCNNEVAYLAWKTDGKINDCLGFMITRINLDTGERRLLPAWVAFDTQSNPKWEEQDTSVWPIQKFSWRDLTLRRSRNTLQIRAPFRANMRLSRLGRRRRAGWQCRPRRPRNPANTKAIRFRCSFAARRARPMHSP
jgi:hypothetical protein